MTNQINKKGLKSTRKITKEKKILWQGIPIKLNRIAHASEAFIITALLNYFWSILVILLKWCFQNWSCTLKILDYTEKNKEFYHKVGTELVQIWLPSK